MSTAPTAHSFTTATDATLASAALRTRALAQISLCGADFALAKGCMS
jgi:hypothetical protein